MTNDYDTPAERQEEKLQTICDLLTLIHKELLAMNKTLKSHR